MEWLLYGVILVAIYSFVVWILCKINPESRIFWENIDTTDVEFPRDFAWGVATASHQIEGNNRNNWSQFEDA